MASLEAKRIPDAKAVEAAKRALLPEDVLADLAAVSEDSRWAAVFEGHPRPPSLRDFSESS